jgi:glycosyltransferase involved in cell wall biosynthesis
VCTGLTVAAVMRVGLDVRYLSHGVVGGINTYLHGLLPALQRLPDAPDLVLYADTKRSFEFDRLAPWARVTHLRWWGPQSSVVNDLLLHRWMARDRIDVAHFPANYGFGPQAAGTIVSIHDALNLLPVSRSLRGEGVTRHPRALATLAYLHFATRAAARRADLLLASSNFTRGELIAKVPRPAAQVVTVPLACPEDAWQPRSEQEVASLRQRYGLQRAYVLADALKNPATLLRAWESLPLELRSRFDLVLFSRRLRQLPLVASAVGQGRARLLVRPPRSDLLGLMRGGAAFAFPSWTEGFGLPLLEAMAAGLPVVASDRGAIPEVVADAALLGPADDADSLAKNLAAILESPDHAAELRTRGRARAGEFTSERTAMLTLEAYRRVVSARGVPRG